MSNDTCSVAGCGRRIRCLELCDKHYRKSRRPRRLTTEERYEKKIDRSAGPDGCHPWIAARNKSQYGMFAHDGETLAARWAYKHFIGPLEDGQHVRHTCDNPPCQNRKHWLPGTNQQNHMDKLERGRQYRPVGIRNPKAKLTPEIVASIRAESTGEHGEQVRLAAKYGISQPSISSILRMETWKTRPSE